MNKEIHLTESDIRAVIKMLYDLAPEHITVAGAHNLAIWMYDNLGITVTTLYLEEVWNSFDVDDNRQSC